MPPLSDHWREILGASLGLLVGASVAWTRLPVFPFHASFTRAAWHPALPAPSPSPADTADQAVSSDDPLHQLARERRSARDWQGVVAAFQDQHGDPDLAQALLLKLDANAVGQLARAVIGWPKAGRNQQFMQAIYRRWGELDPAAALAQARSLDPVRGEIVFQSVIDGFVAADPAAACALLAQSPVHGDRGNLAKPRWREDSLGKALGSWSQADPAAAAAFLSALHRPWMGNGLYSAQIGSEWAYHDPAAAMAWVRTLPDGVNYERATTFGRTMAVWAERDLPGALQYMNTVPADVPDREWMAESLVRVWAKQDLSAATRWANGQSGLTRALASYSVAGEWMEHDPAAAAAFLTTTTDLDPVVDGLRDFHSITKLRLENTWSQTARLWDAVDPAAAEQWISALPSGISRTYAMAGYAGGEAARGNFAQAATWGQQVGDLEGHGNPLDGILYDWVRRDPAAARRWITQAKLPPAYNRFLQGP